MSLEDKKIMSLEDKKRKKEYQEYQAKEAKQRKMTHPTSVNTQTSIFQLRDNIKQKSVKSRKDKNPMPIINLGDYIKPKETPYNKDKDPYVFNPDKYPYNIKRQTSAKSRKDKTQIPTTNLGDYIKPNETQMNKDEDIHNIICENENIEVRVRRKIQTKKNTQVGGKRQTTKRTLRKYGKTR